MPDWIGYMFLGWVLGILTGIAMLMLEEYLT